MLVTFLHMSYRTTFIALASSSHAAAFPSTWTNQTFKKASYYQYALLQPHTMPRNHRININKTICI